MVQTGYDRLTPCQITPNGLKVVANYERELLEEIDDGSYWSRNFECGKCGRWLTEDDLGHVLSEVDVVAPEDVCAEIKPEDYEEVDRAEELRE